MVSLEICSLHLSISETKKQKIFSTIHFLAQKVISDKMKKVLHFHLIQELGKKKRKNKAMETKATQAPMELSEEKKINYLEVCYQLGKQFLEGAYKENKKYRGGETTRLQVLRLLDNARRNLLEYQEGLVQGYIRKQPKDERYLYYLFRVESLYDSLFVLTKRDVASKYEKLWQQWSETHGTLSGPEQAALEASLLS